MIRAKVSVQRENRWEQLLLVIPCVCSDVGLQQEARAIACKVLTNPHQSTMENAQ